MFKKIIILLFVALFLSGCGQKIKTENTQGEKELNIYNWEDYLGETTIADFEKEFGVKVNFFISGMIRKITTQFPIYGELPGLFLIPNIFPKTQTVGLFCLMSNIREK